MATLIFSDDSCSARSTSRTKPAPPPPKKQPTPEVIDAANQLIGGGQINEISPQLQKPVYSYLRNYKTEVLKIPDYSQAQRIEEICTYLLLSISSSQYGCIKNSEISRLKQKLLQSEDTLHQYIVERQQKQKDFDDNKAQQLQELEATHSKALNELDDKYREVPPKFRKLSGEVLNIRQQETFMRQSKRYMEAQQMRDEAAALEAYELERGQLMFQREYIDRRERLLQQQATQTRILLESLDRKWNTYLPVALEKERHQERVISQLKDEIKRQEQDEEGAKATINELLGSSKLPPLGSKTPMARVTTVTNQRQYTHYGKRRVSSSLR